MTGLRMLPWVIPLPFEDVGGLAPAAEIPMPDPPVVRVFVIERKSRD